MNAVRRGLLLTVVVGTLSLVPQSASAQGLWVGSWGWGGPAFVGGFGPGYYGPRRSVGFWRCDLYRCACCDLEHRLEQPLGATGVVIEERWVSGCRLDEDREPDIYRDGDAEPSTGRGDRAVDRAGTGA